MNVNLLNFIITHGSVRLYDKSDNVFVICILGFDNKSITDAITKTLLYRDEYSDRYILTKKGQLLADVYKL